MPFPTGPAAAYFCTVNRLAFVKYHGTGNDFIAFTNAHGAVPTTQHAWFARLCHRRFGIGADGVLVLQPAKDHAFELLYYNADGRPGSLCGNGSRCAVVFAQSLGWISEGEISFLAYDGPHTAALTARGVRLSFGLPSGFEPLPEGGHLLDTGSPHVVLEAPEDLPALDVPAEGRAIRNSTRFLEKGVNVNFYCPVSENALRIRTYERGVEAETYSCGTGAVATAWTFAQQNRLPLPWEIALETQGGTLWVGLNAANQLYLEGPAEKVFEGEVELPKV